MEDNKYYTPTIEEFHVGFEYEQASKKMIAPKQWYKETFYLNNSHIDIIKYSSLDDNVRVKYLDKEDIESLGFEPYMITVRNTFKLNNIIIRLFKKHITVFRYDEYTIDELLFKGTIKNKSELKKLLKQLNIQ